MKLASRLAYVLLLIALGLVVTLNVNHLPKKIVLTAFVVTTCIYFIIRLMAISKKALAKDTVPGSGIFKGLDALLIVSTFGTMLGLLLSIWHMRDIGRLIENISLLLCILGFSARLLALLRSNNTGIAPALRRRRMVLGTVMHLVIICIIVGILLKINHFPGGTMLLYWGTGVFFTFLFSLVIFAFYTKTKSK